MLVFILLCALRLMSVSCSGFPALNSILYYARLEPCYPHDEVKETLPSHLHFTNYAEQGLYLFSFISQNQD